MIGALKSIVLATALAHAILAAAGAPLPIIADLPGQTETAEFRGAAASTDTRRVAEWVASTGDNRGLPFILVDKVGARIFLFDPRARLLGAADALLGLSRGDGTAAGIGQRKLAAIKPDERTTPAGRFVAALGNDFTQDILWIDYDSALSLHRIIQGNPKDRRHQRLQSPTPDDNRISYGCINVPADFYDKLVMPAFTGTVGIVYILPEHRRIDDIFAMDAAQKRSDVVEPSK